MSRISVILSQSPFFFNALCYNSAVCGQMFLANRSKLVPGKAACLILAFGNSGLMLLKNYCLKVAAMAI